MDFHSTSAAFYRRGLKAQVFLVQPMAGNEGAESEVRIELRASSRRQLQRMDENVKRIELFFPGMRRLRSEEKVATLDALEPSQVPSSTTLRFQ